MVNDQRHEIVGRTLGAGEIQRVNGRAVEQSGHPKLLAVGFVEHEIAVKETNRRRAGEVRVGNLRKHVRVGVVDVAGRACRDEQLRAVVHHGHGAGTRNGALFGHNPSVIDLVKLIARHRVGVVAKRPQPSHGASPDVSKQAQARCAAQKRWLFAALGHDLRVEVDHIVIRSVRAAGNVGRA